MTGPCTWCGAAGVTTLATLTITRPPERRDEQLQLVLCDSCAADCRRWAHRGAAEPAATPFYPTGGSW